MDLTDEALLTKFRQTRDPQVFKSLVRRYQNRIFNAAFRILGNAEEAEDVVQDTCIKIHQGIGSLNKSSSFASWIFRIAHNSCLDILRNQQRKRVALNPLPFDPQAMGSGGGGEEGFDGIQMVTQAADPCPNPEERLSMNEEEELISAKLNMLPENQRTVLVLHDIEGFSYQEIAEIVGTSIGTVRSRLHYGRMKMKELLEPYYSSQAVTTPR